MSILIQKLKHIRLGTIWRNLSLLLTEDLRNRMDRVDLQMGGKIENKHFRDALTEHAILAHGENLPAIYQDEVAYLKSINQIVTFPYPQEVELESVSAEWDSGKNMPFVWHDFKRLYFPSNWSVHKAAEQYRYFVEVENLLGGGYAATAPHQYQTDTFHVEEGDVVLDVGAAEGLFALDVIEKAKRVYLIEADNKWSEALQATFEPYRDKAVIVNRMVSDQDTDHSIRLDSLLRDVSYQGLFIKMDIEGNEKTVIQSSRDLLCQDKDIRLVASTYHRHNDEEQLQNLLAGMGFSTHYSDGYMLFLLDKLSPPYFRKGLIRASRTGGGLKE